MKHLFYAAAVIGAICAVCSCAHPAPPLFSTHFQTEKDAHLPNGWLQRVDGFYSNPVSFQITPDDSGEKENAGQNLFSIETAEQPAMFYYTGFYELEDDSVIDVAAEASGTGSIMIGVEFYNSDKYLIGDRKQGFKLIPPFDVKKNHFLETQFRLYFLAKENSRARYARVFFVVNPWSHAVFKCVSLDIRPYFHDQEDPLDARHRFEQKKPKNLKAD